MKKKMVKKEKINFEVPAFVVGVIAIVEAIFSPLLGLVFGVIGLVFSYRQKTVLSKKAKRINWVALVLSAVLFALTLILTFKSSQFAGIFGLR
ncbi:hypothetical protein B6U91_00670 [Candidatus Pacearchaeota archaeon ex4484_71]|nr:MAG: hypothetical protein B6U91_00670 [Candidatus Pacearchaeota archaeon ex4484_71]